ncbi:MAG: Do family serine endopeptidase [Gammaproteobacteria bacterium]|nr:Do family serine endopeptidase [Gammaproteobacteria bacterium]MYH86450.1 Do family serine endopeptidase [Gammaproteobacteria bacterium]MYK05057.1 Do family serine endopeptidase [Gammaproteobacteria bacterium]
MAFTLAVAWFIPAAAAELPNFADLVERSAPAIVEISTSRANQQGNLFDEFDDLFRRQIPDGRQPEEPFQPRTVGSGFIVSDDGYVITNNHVVYGADEIRVHLNDRRVLVADVVGLDEPSDLALLKLEAADLPFVGFGDSDALRIGDWVLAIGSPFGLEFSASAGIVSAKGRTVPRRSSYNYMAFLQTDVAINQGNSGGPLFNLEGEVVGINSRILSSTGGSNGVSFAIPSNVAVNVLDQLRETGAVQRGLLGVQMGEVDYEMARNVGLPRPLGAYVDRVQPASPAERAGLRDGDIITGFNGHEIGFFTELPYFVGQYRPGTRAEVVVRREGEEYSFEVTLGSSPTNAAIAAAEPAPRPRPENPLGFRVADLSGETRQVAGISGVRVAQMAPGPGSDSGLQLNDVITALNGEPVESAGDFARIAEALPESGSIPLEILRQGESRSLSLELP